MSYYAYDSNDLRQQGQAPMVCYPVSGTSGAGAQGGIHGQVTMPNGQKVSVVCYAMHPGGGGMPQGQTGAAGQSGGGMTPGMGQMVPGYQGGTSTGQPGGGMMPGMGQFPGQGGGYPSLWAQPGGGMMPELPHRFTPEAIKGYDYGTGLPETPINANWPSQY
ncbi:hypothetical protein ACFO4N_02990 [Camelliibacillus cellulosilyticus]|uniref:DUF4150 domain-containing protein n=1 Tax=Camelliibacillus cellulosilyticus TaxID=2174486 RepID=A0ABV9GHD1_9BACL